MRINSVGKHYYSTMLKFSRKALLHNKTLTYLGQDNPWVTKVNVKRLISKGSFL